MAGRKNQRKAKRRALRHTKRVVSPAGCFPVGGRVPHQSLGTIRGLLLREPAVAEGIRTVAPNELTYLTDEYKLPRQLETIMGMRNPAAHTGSLERSELLPGGKRSWGSGDGGAWGDGAGSDAGRGVVA